MSLTCESIFILIRIVILIHIKEVFQGIVRMPQNDVLDQMSRLLFDMFVESIDVLIMCKRRTTSHSGCSKLGCNLSCRGYITRSTNKPKKEDICTKGSGIDDNNERT